MQEYKKIQYKKQGSTSLHLVFLILFNGFMLALFPYFYFYETSDERNT